MKNLLLSVCLAVTLISSTSPSSWAQECRTDEIWFVGYDTILEIGRESQAPQYIEIVARGRNPFYGCQVDISLKGRTGQVVWDDGVRFLRLGEVVRHSRAGIGYEFEVIECPLNDDVLQIRVMLDAEQTPFCQNHFTPPEEVNGILLTVLSDEYEVIISSDVFTLNPREEKQIFFETSIDHGLDFAQTSSTGLGAEVSIGPLAASVQREASRSQGVSIGTAVTSGVATTLRGEVCERWLVVKSENHQLVSVTAPLLGVPEPTIMTLVTDVDIRAEALCD